MRIGSDRDPHHTCQSKVGQLDHVGLDVDEEVLRLQVPVEDASLVAVGYSLGDLNCGCTTYPQRYWDEVRGGREPTW